MVIAFDVDGTLYTTGTIIVPRMNVINMMIELKVSGHTIIVWSGGGIQYAKQRINELRLGNYVDHYWPKFKDQAVDLCFDDEDVNLARLNCKI